MMTTKKSAKQIQQCVFVSKNYIKKIMPDGCEREMSFQHMVGNISIGFSGQDNFFGMDLYILRLTVQETCSLQKKFYDIQGGQN